MYNLGVSCFWIVESQLRHGMKRSQVPSLALRHRRARRMRFGKTLPHVSNRQFNTGCKCCRTVRCWKADMSNDVGWVRPLSNAHITARHELINHRGVALEYPIGGAAALHCTPTWPLVIKQVIVPLGGVVGGGWHLRGGP